MRAETRKAATPPACFYEFKNINMKNSLPFVVFLLLTAHYVEAQTFTSTILNKEAIYSNTVIALDYDGDGDIDIVATQRDPDRLIWLENDQYKQFPKHTIIEADITRPVDVDAADLDNDGDIDFVICSSAQIGGFTGELVWFQKQSDNTYIKWSIDVGKDFDQAALADFNGDGLIDIVAVGFNQDMINIYLNDGNLNFIPQILVADLNLNGQVDVVEVGDVDGDGDIDIVFGDGNVNGRIYLNDGNGNFTLGYELFGWNNLSASAGTADIVIVDLNNDGINDVLTFTGQGLGGLYFLDGANSFNQTLIDRDGIDIGGGLAVADFDNNGLIDIVRQHRGKNYISIMYQVSPLEFSNEIIELNWLTEVSSQMVAVDLDGDGDIDLVVPDNRTIDRDISWFENIEGKLYRHHLYAELIGARIPKLGDFDNDGDLDIFLTVSGGSTSPATEDEVLLFENIDGVNFINWRLNDAVDYAADIELGDIDGDGDIDAIVTARDANDLLLLRNDGFQANWITDTIEQNANAPLGLALGDIDGDDDLDIVLCSSGDAKVFWYRNNGNYNFTRFVVDSNLPNPVEAEIADFNGDGNNDIVVISSNPQNTVAIYLSNGMGGFNKEIVYFGKSSRDVEVGDWDGDGYLDIVVSFYNSSFNPANPIDLLLLTNDGNGNFTSSALVSIAEKVVGIRLSDVDNDGDLDVVMGYDAKTVTHPKLISIAINNNGEVEDIVSISETQGGVVPGIDIGDVNNNGKKEIVYADFNRADLVLVDFDISTNIREIINELTKNILIFPNPTSSGRINIISENTELKLMDFKLFNSAGQMVAGRKLSGSANSEVNVEILPAGIYYLLIQTNVGGITKKIVKK